MENRYEREKPSPLHSPKSNGASNGGEFVQTPPPIPRSESYPTTFVQADTTRFKQVVQMLTGSSESPKGHVIPPKKQSFKLYERRVKNNLMISATRQQQEVLSLSILDFPKLDLNSPVTPLIDDPFHRSEEDDRAIAERGFFLHPSHRRDAVAEPQLLPLFPLTSPRLSASLTLDSRE